MTCHNCRIEMVKAGFYGPTRVQRFKCQQCGKRFSEPPQKPFGTDVRLPKEAVCRILNCLVEGNSVRGTARLCGVEKRTVLTMLTLAGEACERLLTTKIQNVTIHDLELDEVWTYVGCKQRRVTPERIAAGMVGDAYVFIGIERTSKLAVAWHLGKRNLASTGAFMDKIRAATAPTPFDVSTDAFEPYENAIEVALWDRASHSSVVKVFRNSVQPVPESCRPPRFICVQREAISGRPDLRRAGTSHVERRTARYASGASG